mmetsp:Transcript_5996/g.14289  ORF Transcript_5996/g.14289 Transcript_5996/m.14289 type:complete len:360 (+) Transcript_5996:161-1240(+)|eukprot:CAMPEP_0171108438 /NCGR_PEP_ID=MMETSP0766_2-20121228/68964_1 /TAXON_ID=439317 /ORGANISM="Gambierdiscus australes, Strain CAWD 149" /LENGTH=359 /DNA_ID=CAMNT_0011569975 /DNA_START=122 /DNA_END=1201 /DNA_ORIENTATION=+
MDLRFKPAQTLDVASSQSVQKMTRGSPQDPGFRRLNKVQSAPLLPAAHSTQGITWYSGNGSLASGARQSCWKPLGATWRDWETDSIGRVRSSVDESSSFVQGCVPHWGKEACVRARGVLEHELTWAYYRMRRHVQHPLRKQVGETLPRGGAEINFWQDLRPPFFVLRVKRANAGGDEGPHADGELYKVTYECGLEYASEHMLGAKGEGGFSDHRIHSEALVRFSNSFPRRRPLHIVSWGEPVLNWSPTGTEDENPVAVDPEIWMPIAEELGVRPDDPSLEACRALTREATGRKAARDRRGVEVPELERLLLGPHASLPRLAAATQNLLKDRDLCHGPPGPRKRAHTVYTPAAGFVRYAG